MPGTDWPIRLQRIAGYLEWNAQFGKIAAKAKTGKAKKGDPNDQCLALITFLGMDVLRAKNDLCLAPIGRFGSSG